PFGVGPSAPTARSCGTRSLLDSASTLAGLRLRRFCPIQSFARQLGMGVGEVLVGTAGCEVNMGSHAGEVRPHASDGKTYCACRYTGLSQFCEMLTMLLQLPGKGFLVGLGKLAHRGDSPAPK